MGRDDKAVYSDELIITKANQSISCDRVSLTTTPRSGSPQLDGASLDAETNDGYVFRMGDQGRRLDVQG